MFNIHNSGGMRGFLSEYLQGDSQLAREHQYERASTLPSEGSHAYGQLSPEQRAAVDAERKRRRESGQQNRREYLDSVGGYGNYEGGFDDGAYWQAGNPSMEGSYYWNGQIYDGSGDPTGGYTGGGGGGLGAGHWQGGGGMFGGGGLPYPGGDYYPRPGAGDPGAPPPGGGGGGTHISAPTEMTNRNSGFLSAYRKQRELANNVPPADNSNTPI